MDRQCQTAGDQAAPHHTNDRSCRGALMLVNIVVYDGIDELDALGSLKVLRPAGGIGMTDKRL